MTYIHENEPVVQDPSGRTVKAGGIVLWKKPDTEYLLLIYRHKYRDWSFPKGHAQQNETPEQTATREIFEECGVQSTVVGRLPHISFVNPRLNIPIFCHMFILHPVTTELHPENPQDIAEWVPIGKVYQRLTSRHLKAYFLEVAPQLQLD